MSEVTITTVLAPNPGHFTGPGTNSYIVASAGQAVIIDPGPRIPDHEAAIVAALRDATPVAVLVTHTHPDHAPAANPIAARLGVPAMGAARGSQFEPDGTLGEGDVVTFGATAAVAVATPGHTADHLCFLVGDVLFTGDHLMGGSTVIIEDLTAYLASLRKLLPMGLRRLYPGHGPEIDAPNELIDHYIAHRLEREGQILAALGSGAQTVGAIVQAVYRELDTALHLAASWSVAAHLRKLSDEGRVHFSGAAEWGAPARRSGGRRLCSPRSVRSATSRRGRLGGRPGLIRDPGPGPGHAGRRRARSRRAAGSVRPS